MQFRCQRLLEKGRVLGVDDKSDYLYGSTGLSGSYGYTFQTDSCFYWLLWDIRFL